MFSGRTGAVGRQLEVLWTSGTLTGLSDAQLLSRFAEARDTTGESAFRELLHRHGPMVLGVCRQILRQPHDADDAFQATFLILVRKARSVRVGQSLAPWLYGVAYRTAQRARVRAARFRSTEFDPMEEPMESPSEDAARFDLRPLLHEELNRLPDKYREPIVLCHLEGKSHEEAARLLSWPVGTVSGRLSRGRQILKSRLERRGVTVSSAMLATNWLAGTPAPLMAPLLDSTLAAAIRFAAAQSVSTSILALTQGVLRTMWLNQIKTTALVILIAGGVTGGIGVWAYQASPASSRPTQAPAGELASAPAQVSQKSFVAAPQPQPNQPAGLPPFGVGGGFPAVPPRLKNSPNLAGPRDSFPGLRSKSILVVESPDRTAWQAMTLERSSATWRKLSFPPGITAAPLMSDDTLALILKGKTIDHVAAFSVHTGDWSKQHLLEPVEGEINPVLGPGCALYQTGNNFYAFSSPMGKWGVLHLESGEEAKASISSTDIEVLQGNKLYVFIILHGEWSKGVEVNLKPFRTDSRQADSAGTPKGAP